VEREPASSWYRFHVAQAVAYGLYVCAIALAALLWPLFVSLIFANGIAVLWIYAVALLVDIALFAIWLMVAVGYSKQAARGKMFEISRIARLTRRVAGNR
jgi:hypothetical protein